jgi:PD-(D/E)XK endonuclease
MTVNNIQHTQPIRTNSIGNISEAKVLSMFTELGYTVSIPFGTGCSYDYVIDDGTQLLRVQVKTGRLRQGCVHFAAWSHNGSRGNHIKKRYLARADVFAVYCPENDKIYLVPVEDVGVEGRLRIDAPRNSQSKYIRWASPYELVKGFNEPCSL